MNKKRGTISISKKFPRVRGTHSFIRDSCGTSREETLAALYSSELLIHGENLCALKLLRENPDVLGKVRLVYIDPPFGTRQRFTVTSQRVATISRGNGGTVAYKDELWGDAYLSFLKMRLQAIRNLMAEDGSIYLHIDCKIGHRVKCLMDEVFGAENFVNDITRIKFESSASGIIFLNATEGNLRDYANEKFGAGLRKRPDFVAKAEKRYVVGEAKFLSSEGGEQRGGFEDAVSVAAHPAGGAVKVSILDGIVWLESGSGFYQYIQSSSINVFSALLLRDFLESL